MQSAEETQMQLALQASLDMAVIQAAVVDDWSDAETLIPEGVEQVD